ncbi:hypothetical protein EYF80_021539 [Liparis tanakae]|uniref:Uncharacterized protein n=1 Tax=Liparis tanakae TaxID=230148 RepID=A0A4Z2HR76_9TELE|nr:hypothetical protein EYF80_021539 [Liparis tanakae]
MDVKETLSINFDFVASIVGTKAVQSAFSGVGLVGAVPSACSCPIFRTTFSMSHKGLQDAADSSLGTAVQTRARRAWYSTLSAKSKDKRTKIRKALSTSGIGQLSAKCDDYSALLGSRVSSEGKAPTLFVWPTSTRAKEAWHSPEALSQSWAAGLELVQCGEDRQAILFHRGLSHNAVMTAGPCLSGPPHEPGVSPYAPEGSKLCQG